MWDPDYMNYVLDYFEEQAIGLPPSYSEDIGALEESDEEEDEEEDEDEAYDDGETDGGSGVEGHELVNADGQAFRNADEAADDRSSPRRTNDVSKEEEAASCKDDDHGDKGKEEALNTGEIDGLCCPICFEAWSSGGDHHICCLPCGHIYGLSCIKKWLRRRGSSKCPQCKKKCGIKDIRLLYASKVVAIDGELQKKVRSLEVKCASFKKKNDELSKREIEWKKRETEICKKMLHFKKRVNNIDDMLKEMENRSPVSSTSDWNSREEFTFGLNANSKFHLGRCSSKFAIQKNFQVDGARFFDIDCSNSSFIIARRLSGFGGMDVLTKMSFLHSDEKDDIQLPGDMKAIRDLRISPHSKLVLLASMGKKLSILSTESNNTVLTYDLLTAAWSCSWDFCSPHHIFAGLQNGTVLQFDMRNTRSYVESMTGFTGNPIHTIYSISPDSRLSSGMRSVLTGSSLGLCHWNFGGNEEKPYLIPETEKQGVCISLAYSAASEDIVASFRPKIEACLDLEISQPIPTPSASVTCEQVVRGSHVHFKRMGSTYQKTGATCANVSSVRLPKSVMINGESEHAVFASGDEAASELILQDIPSFMIVDRLKPRKHPIRDIRYARPLNSELLCCLSEDCLQVYTHSSSSER